MALPANTRWKLEKGKIIWDTQGSRLPHEDDIEMSGRGISYVVKYGADAQGRLLLARHAVWPAVRNVPNDTGASFQMDIAAERLPLLLSGGQPVEEQAVRFAFDGVLRILSRGGEDLEIRRDCYPSPHRPCAYERIRITTTGASPLPLTVQDQGGTLAYPRGRHGVSIIDLRLDRSGDFLLAPGYTLTLHLQLSARGAWDALPPFDAEKELDGRMKRVTQLTAPLRLETGDEVLDAMFRFAKLRAGESIFDTHGGPLHSPGGYSYYAATWCNDEIEYAGPWLAFTGDPLGMEASLNAYRQYIPFMGPDYRHIPSSIIAEGVDFWEGAGDRGDAAMYLYGASQFALFGGDPSVSRILWPAIRWCAEYCRRQLNADGVVASDADELEGRFPAGKANLSTSCLYEGGLRLAAILAQELGEPETGEDYLRRAEEMDAAIERTFGRTVSGYDTYAYYEGNDQLRSWICLPLCMGLRERREATVEALLSPRLWTKDGQLSCEGDATVWDRSTLYGFRGAFISGYGDRVMPALREYAENRLLGERVPYAIEAWPEGGKRHLSGESALFCRMVTEGMLGIRPAGHRQFTFVPRLPEGLDRLILREIPAFGSCFDIEVLPDGTARVIRDGDLLWEGPQGREVRINLE